MNYSLMLEIEEFDKDALRSSSIYDEESFSKIAKKNSELVAYQPLT